jgi:hypothetical protein
MDTSSRFGCVDCLQCQAYITQFQACSCLAHVALLCLQNESLLRPCNSCNHVKQTKPSCELVEVVNPALILAGFIAVADECCAVQDLWQS